MRKNNLFYRHFIAGIVTVLHLVVLHTLYFLFLRYTASFHRRVPENPNWFRYPFLILSLLVPLLQTGAFLKTVRQRQPVARTARTALGQRQKARS